MPVTVHHETSNSKPQVDHKRAQTALNLNNMSEMWVQCFTCCVTEQPQTVSLFKTFCNYILLCNVIIHDTESL